jgi:hypothetical protein
MADYSKATNFTAKDGLPTGNAGKIVKGTEIDTELTAIASAIASKANINSPTFTGTPAGPTASAGTNTTQIATTAFVTAALATIYPVGSIYINASVSTNPATLMGFGTWTVFGEGKVIVGLDSADALFDTLEETGGSKDAIAVTHTHTATVTDPTHFHTTDGTNGSNTHAVRLGSDGIIDAGSATISADDATYTTGSKTGTASTGITVSNASAGSSGTNANVQPFIVVKMWKRTA